MVMAIMAAAFLFRVKHEVLAIEKKIAHVTQTIGYIQSDTNLLHSELAYLTQPQRILHLGRMYLKELETLSPQQLAPNPLGAKGSK